MAASLPSGADRVLLVFSDVEMGPGGHEDDFPHSEFLLELMARYQEPPYRNLPLDVVFNGDSFDLLKTDYLGGFPHHISADVALTKMAAVLTAHPRFFPGLRDFLAHEPAPRQAHFVVGNHDAELLFPQVQSLVRSLSGGRNVNFPGFSMRLGPVYLEHGSQQDVLFRQDPKHPFITLGERQLLNISWASIALLSTVMPLKRWLCFHERLRPRERVMSLVPELKELLLARVWKYWTLDFWREFLAVGDPLLKLDWKMVQEVFWRFTTQDTEVKLDPAWLRETVEQTDAELFVVGHLHQLASYEHGDKRILHTGCMRDEFWVDEAGTGFRPALKNYLEVHLRQGRVAGLISHELLGPPRNDIPSSVWDALDDIEAAMDELGDQASARAQRAKLEKG